jgi:ribonuclease E
MVKRMLIDATHPEETRVVVMNGTRLEEFDVETSTKRQIKGNVYLAKVVRVEPSLQAAFVDYGGNRHGFLAFSEIHPDYYQIPVADRQRLIAEQASQHADENRDPDQPAQAEATDAAEAVDDDANAEDHGEGRGSVESSPEHDDTVEHVGGDDADDATVSRSRQKPYRQYKIQEVIKRRQIMLVQVVKEERGNKGAALTTFLSLAGRYCVLMPNTPRGGGVSRKITSATDRRRLKDMMSGLEIPDGMAVIVRTAGSERSKAEIKRDYEYLLRTWSVIRTTTLESRAPALVYEEATLIKRAIRDIYAREIEEVLVEGDEGYRVAKDFMKALTPSHAKKVQPYKDSHLMPLFHRHQVESQLEALHNIQVTLKSGGYIVINPTEALVSIDVNSGRSTRERNIEETALKTNLEASDEIARQLRLRDLAGLVVIDYIDMEDAKNNAAVERRLKEALRSDRARIQVGRISPFGLMELSRQRLRPSFVENSYVACPHCKGSGMIRSTESEVVRILRVIEEEGVRRRSAEISVTVPIGIALYILNQKRTALAEIEARYGFSVMVHGSDTMMLGEVTLDRLRALTKEESDALAAAAPPADTRPIEPDDDVDETEDEADESQAEPEVEDDETAAAALPTPDEAKDGGRNKKRRRRKRRGKRGGTEGAEGETPEAAAETVFPVNENGTVSIEGEDEGEDAPPPGSNVNANGDDEPAKKSRRRGRRGGRRRNRPAAAGDVTVEQVNDILSEPLPEVVEIAIPSIPEAPSEIEIAAVPTEPVEVAIEVPAAEVTVDAAPAEEAPAKPKRTRKPAAPKAKTAETEAPAAPEAKPKRTRKPAAPKAKAAEPEAPVEADAPAAVAEKPAEAPAAAPTPVAVAAPEPQPEPEVRVEEAKAAEPAESGPPRRGWWSRG